MRYFSELLIHYEPLERLTETTGWMEICHLGKEHSDQKEMFHQRTKDHPEEKMCVNLQQPFPKASSLTA